MRLQITLTAALLALPLMTSCGTTEMNGDGYQKRVNTSEASGLEDESLQLSDGTYNSEFCQDEEKRELVASAIEAGDFFAWKEAITSNGKTPRVLDKINEENFALFAEAYLLAQQGDTEGADAIRVELDLRKLDERRQGRDGNGKGKGKGNGEGNGNGKRNGYHRS